MGARNPVLVLLAAAGAGGVGHLRPNAAQGNKHAVPKHHGVSESTQDSNQGHCHVALPRHAVQKGEEQDAIGFIGNVFEKYEENAYEPSTADATVVLAAARAVGKTPAIQCTEDEYGEIPQESALQLLSDPMVNLRSEETFLDMGSGLGRLVVDAAVFGGIHRSVGVELSPARHSASCSALREVSAAMPVKRGSGWRAERHESQVDFFQGDIQKIDRDILREANVVYLASLCFRTELLVNIQHELEQTLPSGARVLTLTAFDKRKAHTSRFKPKGQLAVPMSWSVPGYSQAVYVYDVQ